MKKLTSPVSLFVCALVLTAGAVSGVCMANPGQAGSVQNATAAVLSVTGAWKFSWIDKNGDARQGTMQLKQDGSSVSGSFKGDHGPFAVVGTLQGNQISLTVKAPMRKVSFTGTVDGGKMGGATEAGKTWTAVIQ
jgi:hypothetical protein